MNNENKKSQSMRMLVIATIIALIARKGASADGVVGTITCENESVILNCFDGKVINVIEANYGRTDASTCPVTTSSSTAKTTNTSCISTTTLSKIKRDFKACQGKETCDVEATSALFGDTCSGTYKYLNVSYECVNDWPVLKLTDGTVEVKNMLGEVSVNANLNVYGNMNVSNGDIITGDSSLSEFRARIAKIESASETISKLQAQLDSVPRPPICMPPGADSLQFNGTSWICACAEGWLGTSCTIPPWSEQQKIVASDGADDEIFGQFVDIDKDTIVVTSRADDKGIQSGGVYVYVRSGLSWTFEQKIVASDGEAGDRLGQSVAINGDTIVIGAYGDDDKGSNSGSVYVYVRLGTTWSLQQKIVPSDGGASDLFGHFVDLDGDTIVVGAYGDQDQGNFTGSVYVYVRSGTAWSLQHKIVADDGFANDYFGYTLSFNRDTIVVGAYGDDDKGTSSGSAYVYFRSGSTWSLQQKLNASDGAENDAFSISVAIDGDTIAVGSFLDDDDDKGINSGSVYVYVRSGTTWSEEQKLVASDGAANDLFGYPVSLVGNTLVVGAYSDDDNDASASGSAYVFVRSGSAWSAQQKLTAADGEAGDRFGYSLAIEGDTIVVGAYTDDDKGTDSGSVYVYAANHSRAT